MTKQDFMTGRANTPTQLRVANIFLTVDGETNAYHQGSWSVFVRLQGCRVGCTWCDTKYSWPIDTGRLMYPEEMMDEVARVSHTVKKITLTGGEPMEQDGGAMWRFLSMAILERGYQISMETAGVDDLRELLRDFPRLNVIADFKLSSARATRPVHIPSLLALRHSDVIKFVATLEEMTAVGIIAKSLRDDGCAARMVLSPVQLPSTPALGLFVSQAKALGYPRLGIGLNLQLHKYIWKENFRDEEEGTAAPMPHVGAVR